MRVLIDATAVPADRGGVGRYVDELVPRLDAQSTDLVLAVQPRDVAHYRTLAPAGRVVAAPQAVARRPVRLVWEQVGLPTLARRVRADVLHCPHYTMPLLPLPGRTPVVVTLHDATFFTDAHLHLPTKARFFRVATRVATRRAAGLVVPSVATRDEVIREAGGDPGRFTVAYHGVDTERFHPTSTAEQDRVRSTLDIGDLPYVAFLGTLEPRKNVPALVRGWVQACTALDTPPALVLAGGKGWDHDIDAALAEVPAHLTVRRTGYLPLDDLAGLLGGALAVAYPSLGEGFGLPVLEAMACGAPTLTTRALSLPEVGGDAVAYCGTSAESIAEGLVALCGSTTRRAELSAAAVERAATFTWERAARDHAAAYARAAAR